MTLTAVARTAIVGRMRATASLATVLLLAGCGSDPDPPCVDCGWDAGRPPDVGDAGESDDGGGGDAGAGDDAGTGDPDAGGGGECGDGLPSPAAFDCEASDPGLTFGDAITAEARTWTFVPFDDAFCMDGSTTGIGVSLNPASDRVMIYLQGGGACFDTLSCLGVANRDGFAEAELDSLSTFLSRGIFDRDDPDNPVADWNHVFIPYCSGDVHAGTRADGPDGRAHVGYQNVTAYLRRLVPTFDGATQVLLTGASAGGLGAMVNYEQTQEAFDCTPVDALDDAGSILPEPYLRPCLQQRLRERWGLGGSIPSECGQCTCDDGSGMWNMAPYLAARFPDRRFGLVTSMEDGTMRGFYGYGYSASCDFPATMPGEDYAAGLTELRSSLDGRSNFQTFYVAGAQHTFTYEPLGDVSTDGTTLSAWLEGLLDGEASWDDVGP